jgi:sterol desaturase/sphingolipid hydroxylase (fatty acid hydroxylase superfamily)
VIWDRLFGTIHPQYEALYDRITEDAGEVAEESRAPVLTQ